MDYRISISAALAAIMTIVWWIAWRRRATRKNLSPSGLAIFISGCDTGIGNRLAKFFDEIGCDVYAGCLDSRTARPTLPETVSVVDLDITCDISVGKALQTVKKSLVKKNKVLWAVINNAGVCVYGEFDWLTWGQCEQQVAVNFLGTMRLTKAFLPLLRQSNGRIVTITSINGVIAYPGLAVYSGTKFGLEGFHDSLRIEQRNKVKVIVVQPGDLARLTCIMSRHEENARDMWDNMSQEDKEHYDGYFQRYHRVTLKNYGLTSPEKFEDSPLLKDVREAVLSLEPADRYVSAPVHFRFVYWLLALMPKSACSTVIGKLSDYILRTGDTDEVQQ